MQKPQRLCQANWDARGYLSLWASNGADISLIDNALSSLEVQIANVQKIYLKSPEAGGFNEKEVDSISIEPIEAINLLTLDWKNLSSTLDVSDTFLFWREAAKLLLELLSKGRFLPSLVKKNLSWHSCWKPILEESGKLEILAEAMPLACQFTTQTKHDSKDLLSDFLTVGTDKMVRTFIGDRLFLEIPEIEELENQTPAFWLKSIFARDSQIRNDSNQLLNLENQLIKWSSKFSPAAIVPTQYKLGFKLIEPYEDDIPWVLGFSLFTEKDRFEIRASDIWSGDKDLEIFFLKELGKAIKIFPRLRDGLARACPEAMKLTTAEAYFFMKDLAPLLTSSGFMIYLPDWWESTEEHLNLTLNISSTTDLTYTNNLDRPLGSLELLNFKWEMAIGDTPLTIEKVQELASNEIPLTFINGKWVKLSQEKFTQSIEFIAKQQGKTAYSVIDAIRYGLGLEEEDLPNIKITGTGWFEKLIACDVELLDVTPVPANLKTTLRPYQHQGLSWMDFLSRLGIGACLADDMGLGKTVQFIALLLSEKNMAPTRNAPTLLVVPMSVLPNWEEEIIKFAPSLKICTHHGARSSSLTELKDKASSADLVLTTYSILQRDEKLLAEISWKRIALDEA